jgi:MFS superfamily sulfate permease-like transporter
VKIHWPDLLVGLAISGLVLPEAVAYAGIAGVPPLSGLLGAVAGLTVYALLGRSRFPIVAATSSSAAVLAAALNSMDGVAGAQALELSAAIVLMAGVLFIACSVLRLGNLAQYIARPVVHGFSLGIAVVITARQLAKLCGLHAVHTSLGPLLVELFERRAQWHLPSILIGLGAFALLLLLRRWPRVPGTLLVLVLGIACIPWIGAHAAGVALVGEIKLSSVQLHLPALRFDEWTRAADLAVALMLILFAESYGAVRSCALRHGEVINVNRELLALGAANMAAGLFRGVPVGAGYSATYTNESLGPQSRLAGLAAAVSVAAALCFLKGWVARIPEPVLAAIVIFAMRHAASIKPLLPYLIWKRDRFVIVTAVAAVLVLGVLDGLLVAIAVSLVMLIRELSQPRLSVLGRLDSGHDFVSTALHPQAVTVPGLLILRPEEPLFFGNVEAVLDSAAAQLAAAASIHTLVLSLEESPDLDGTAVQALGQFAAQVQRHASELRLARLKDPVLEVLTTAALPGMTGAALSGGSVDAVVGAVLGERGSQSRPVLS